MRNLPVLISGGLLAVFGVIGSGMVAISHEGTAARIAANERQALLEKLQTLVPPERVDNDMLVDYVDVRAPASLGTDLMRVYRGRRDDQPVAAVLSPIVTQGYAGGIHLVVAVQNDGLVSGVRVLRHRETPGLGDKIEIERSDWITSFNGKSLLNPGPTGWQVKRDGGTFDQFAGATITPRAVVAGVRAALTYFDANKPDLFEAPTMATEEQRP